MVTNQTEVVTELNRCAEIVTTLMTEESEVAVDAKGVNLGRTGPLTLLQVGTRDGQAYLFDVHTNKALLTVGYLKDLLEAKNVVKIIHLCRWDSAALIAQFGVVLNNVFDTRVSLMLNSHTNAALAAQSEVALNDVFDTRVAHMEVELSKGNVFPCMLKLSDMCETYGGNSATLAFKNDVKKDWWMETAAYWASRPLTPEMIQYAAANVSVLFGLYDNLSRKYVFPETLIG
ncbi:piRNA biogenesis protein EXD1-like [Liolophura sinensis]|uniref:piRNA biogenesis protein EXD1-like n=1 Tax=Liolophura sinensis TaxID=3198878 RepID=UPI00315807A3